MDLLRNPLQNRLPLSPKLAKVTQDEFLKVTRMEIIQHFEIELNTNKDLCNFKYLCVNKTRRR